MMGRMATKHDLSPQHLMADEAFQGLLRRARDFAREGMFPARNLANTLHSVAKLCAARRVDVTDGAVEETLEALETAVVRVAASINPQELANIVWAYATLGRAPKPETWRALESAAVRVAPSMKPQELANTVWAYATLGRATEPETWRALETAAARVVAGMVPEELANTLWAYATLGRAPEPETWRALESAAVRVAPSMKTQNLANTVWAYATLGRTPDPETWRALESAAVRAAASMKPRELANTVWAYTFLSSLRDVLLSSSYAVLWELVCNMEARDFIAEGQTMLFHAYLMHQSFLSSRVLTNISTPPWLLVEARDAWMSQLHYDVTVSRSQRELAQTLDELGVRHEVEHVTDDGYFSIDIYLPDHDIAVEFDGPSHYYSRGSSSLGGGDGTTTKNAKTELRDLFLGQRCTKVLTVPWFEFSKFNASAVKRTSYVRELLAKEGIAV
jgi:hypothetical protein